MIPEICDLASLPLPSNPQAPACEVFRAQIRHQDGSTRKAHLKVLLPKALVCELLVADIGRKIGMPVPDCFLVRVKKPQFHLLEKSARWKLIKKDIEKNGADVVALFASATLEHPTLDHYLEAGNHTQNIVALVAEIAELETAAIFDEWVANPDRHFQNILLADMKTWWLIDHDLAFNQRQFEIKPLLHDETFENCLADVLLPNPLTISAAQKWRATARKMAPQMKRSSPDEILRDMGKLNFLTPVEAEMLGGFLLKRSSALSKLILARLERATGQLPLGGSTHV